VSQTPEEVTLDIDRIETTIPIPPERIETKIINKPPAPHTTASKPSHIAEQPITRVKPEPVAHKETPPFKPPTPPVKFERKEGSLGMRSDGRMNVLFLVADDMRSQSMVYGKETFTPSLARLAARGVVFDRAYAQVYIFTLFKHIAPLLYM
jgi:hypothetical protein